MARARKWQSRLHCAGGLTTPESRRRLKARKPHIAAMLTNKGESRGQSRLFQALWSKLLTGEGRAQRRSSTAFRKKQA